MCCKKLRMLAAAVAVRRVVEAWEVVWGWSGHEIGVYPLDRPARVQVGGGGACVRNAGKGIR